MDMNFPEVSCRAPPAGRGARGSLHVRHIAGRRTGGAVCLVTSGFLQLCSCKQAADLPGSGLQSCLVPRRPKQGLGWHVRRVT